MLITILGRTAHSDEKTLAVRRVEFKGERCRGGGHRVSGLDPSGKIRARLHGVGKAGGGMDAQVDAFSVQRNHRIYRRRRAAVLTTWRRASQDATLRRTPTIGDAVAEILRLVAEVDAIDLRPVRGEKRDAFPTGR